MTMSARDAEQLTQAVTQAIDAAAAIAEGEAYAEPVRLAEERLGELGLAAWLDLMTSALIPGVRFDELSMAISLVPAPGSRAMVDHLVATHADALRGGNTELARALRSGWTARYLSSRGENAVEIFEACTRYFAAELDARGELQPASTVLGTTVPELASRIADIKARHAAFARAERDRKHEEDETIAAAIAEEHARRRRDVIARAGGCRAVFVRRDNRVVPVHQLLLILNDPNTTDEEIEQLYLPAIESDERDRAALASQRRDPTAGERHVLELPR